MKLGELLIQKKLITEEQLVDILVEQKDTNALIGDILIEKGYLTREKLTPILAELFNIPYVKLQDKFKSLDQEIVACVPKELAYRLKVIPIERENNTLRVAISDPLDIAAVDTLRITTGFRIKPVICLESEIIAALEYCYHSLPKMKEQIESFIDLEAESKGGKKKGETEVAKADDPPVVAYVKSLIIQAFNNNASDVFLQAQEGHAESRFRIDGILSDQEPPPIEMLAAIVSRIKILSGLNIAEKRIPQDGRFRIKIGDRNVDIRVSSIPTIHGESIVMRLLNASSVLLGLDELGFQKNELDQYQKILSNSYGLILITGPTGSGKTTTLYSSLNAIKTRTKHIITMEDPVEYRLPFVTQCQVNAKVGFNFASGLRSILRQSPDVILVGEIRDRETAEIAIHASMTGHLVFSTLHTNDAANAAVRLINMGIEPYLITSCLLGVVAQRLIRLICPDCREEQPISNKFIKKQLAENKIDKIYHGKGCEKCFQTGYRGRAGLYEILTPNEKISRMIVENRSSQEIKESAIQAGMKTLRQSAMERLREGETTLEEVVRLTQETETV